MIYRLIGFISNNVFNYDPGQEPADRRYDLVVVRQFWTLMMHPIIHFCAYLIICANLYFLTRFNNDEDKTMSL